MVNNSMHQVNHAGFNSPRTNTSQVYGGYFPTTGRNESKVFYAEISTSSEKNSSPSGDDKMQGFLRRTRSTSPKKVLSNSHIPFLKTNYLSRKSLSRKSAERSPRAQNSLKWNLTGVYCTYLLQDTNFRGWVESVIDNYFALWCGENETGSNVCACVSVETA